jgi:hypothetical protein
MVREKVRLLNHLIGIAVLVGSLGLACGEEESSETASPTSSTSATTTPENPGEQPGEVKPKQLSPEEGVLAALKAWCGSQKRGGVEVYSTMYSGGFKGIRRTSKGKARTFDRKGWMKDREPGFSSPLKVDCRNPKVTMNTGNEQAEVTFEQYFRTSTYADQGDKKLAMVQGDSGWLLVSEDMISSKKWDRKSFRDGSPATDGPPKVKVGRLGLRKVRALVAGRDKPMKGDVGSSMDYVQNVCNARSPLKLRGFQVTPKKLKSAEVAAYQYAIRGSTTLFEDDEGYMACNERKLKPIGGGMVEATGDTIALVLDKTMKDWPCSYKIKVTALGADGTPRARGHHKGSVSCPE